MTLAFQILQILVQHGVSNPSNVVLCGTQRDYARPNVIEEFRGPFAYNFWKKLDVSGGLLAVVDHEDYSELVQALQKVPCGCVQYTPPPADKLGHLVAKLLGACPEQIISDLSAARTANETLSLGPVA